MSTVKNPEDGSEMTLAEYLESGQLNCLACSGPMLQCRLLPCLDSLCQRCLENFLERAVEEKADYFVCPACEEQIPIPKLEGEEKNGDALDHFKRNIFYEFLLELVDCKSVGQKVCDYCIYDQRTTSASARCMDCQDNLCEPCSAAHRRTKMTRNHKIAPFAEIRNHRYDHDIRASQQLVCPAHPQQQLSLFCERCCQLLCTECKLHGHDDHQWMSVTDAGQRFQKKVAALHTSVRRKLPEMTTQCKGLKTYMRELTDNAKKVAVELEQQAQLLHQMVEKEKKKALGDLQKIVNDELKSTETRLKSTNRGLKGLKSNDAFLTALLSLGKQDELMYLYPELTRRLSKVVYVQGADLKKKMKVEFAKGVTNEQNVQIIFGKVEGASESVERGVATVQPRRRLTISSVLPTAANQVQLVKEFTAKCPSDRKDVWPSGLAVTSLGDYVIVDRGNKRVKLFDQNGNLTSDFSGTGSGLLRCPFDVTITQNGDLAITDYESEEIKIFSLSGKYQRSVRGKFKYPRGIETLSDGTLAVMDCHDNQLLLLDTDDVTTATINGKDDCGFPYFSDPYYVASTRDGNLVVSDWSAPNVKIFSRDGHLLAKYGTYGIQSDQSLQPYGVCVDEYGYIFLADNTNHRVHMLLPDGSFVRFLLTKEDGLWHPMALAIDKQGKLVVTQGLGQVKVYRYM